MSVRVNRDYSRSKYTAAEKPVKKFCGVCQKAGLSEREYTSHFTKSVPGPQGIVICPTILNNECSFCFNFGHFKSACPALAEREKQQKRSEAQDKRFKQQDVRVQKSSAFTNGGFSVLADSDSDSESNKKQPAVGIKRSFSQVNKPEAKVASKVASKDLEWPALCSKPSNTSTVTDKPSFATVISTAAPVKKVDTSRPNICGFTVLTNTGSSYTPSESAKKYRSWLEDSDTEDEEDYVDNSAW